jgi:hypothetical protein
MSHQTNGLISGCGVAQLGCDVAQTGGGVAQIPVLGLLYGCYGSVSAVKILEQASSIVIYVRKLYVSIKNK